MFRDAPPVSFKNQLGLHTGAALTLSNTAVPVGIQAVLQQTTLKNNKTNSCEHKDTEKLLPSWVLAYFIWASQSASGNLTRVIYSSADEFSQWFSTFPVLGL